MGRSWLRRLAVWRSPEDQPGWARPLLFGVAVLSAALCAWRAGTYLELYYAAAVRSMSMSWHNFFFAAFDPTGTVTLDKLPGAFWIQALSVRVFGVHTWAIVLPQVVEGVLSVLVLYRIVRRLCGPVAGLLAAVILALSPATVTLNRGNISDSLMVLLLLLAADAAVTSITTGRWRSLLLSGLWVGLAFQAKMVEAWIVLPALGLMYLIAATGTLRQRLLRIGAMGILAGLVSLSWMTVVTLTSASTRPYVDGSQNNSLFQQVFVYNGFGRLDQASPNQLLTRSIGIQIPPPPPAAWNWLLTGPFGRNTGWLLPAALLTLVAGLGATRRRPRGDAARASFVLWGTWLLAFAITFSFSSSINSYYTAALSPPIAGLIGAGSVLAWRRRQSIGARLTVAATIVITVGYACGCCQQRERACPDGWHPRHSRSAPSRSRASSSPHGTLRHDASSQQASLRRWSRCCSSPRRLRPRLRPIASDRSTPRSNQPRSPPESGRSSASRPRRRSRYPDWSRCAEARRTSWPPRRPP